jgi:hypothetical protein
MKQFAAWFTHGIPNGSTLRKSIFEARSGPAVLSAVESFFANRASQPHEHFTLEPDAQLDAAPANWG